MYFTSGSDRAFEQLMQGKPGFDHYDSGEAVTPEDCGTCRFYRPHWKYQFCVYAECPYQPGKLTAYDAVTFRVKGVENMAVFRVERNKGYTVMSNHHLRNKDLSLKAKGLLLGHLQLLKKENLSAGQTQRIETIFNKAERMKELIQTFYDLSVIDAKEVTPVREDFNLTNLLINLITENAPALEAKGISPVIGLPDHSVYLHSDYGMVERIFQNLIINAIRYSSGSIKIDLKQGKEKSAIFIIENPIDSKVEIDPNRLFERFYTGDKSRHNSGTGVGLAVVKLLTDKLGGNVFAKIENDTLTISLEIK